jgi:iron complex outermembrane receptor protein
VSGISFCSKGVTIQDYDDDYDYDYEPLLIYFALIPFPYSFIGQAMNTSKTLSPKSLVLTFGTMALSLLLSPDAKSATNTIETVVVSARRWTEPLQSVPGAVTVQNADTLQSAGVRDLRDAAPTVPNLTLGDFSVRRLTFPYMRGIGSGRNSPAVTTIIDGVPQLSYATANQELLDVERIEFLRGAQGSLYGRNTLGGAINIVPRLPTRDPAASFSLATGSENFFDARASSEGPLGANKAAGSASAGYSRRDGYTHNDITGNRLDRRESFFGRAQMLWPDEGPWTYRLSAGGEVDRDGDYGLGDLATIRAHPHHVAHDYEGSSERDLAQPVFTATRKGDKADFVSTTAFQWWRSHDRTDLDATPADLIRRDNEENQQAYIEELRLMSPENAPVTLGDRLTLRWLLGALAFHSSYSQRAFNDYRPGSVAMLGLPFPFQQHDDADLADTGLSLFGHTTLTLDERWELGLGIRDDYEHRSADRRSYASIPLMPASGADDSADFNQISPRTSLGYHLTQNAFVYGEASKGFKAGGFNTLAIPGHTRYGDETSWTYETGLKTDWLSRRVTANLALFHTDWNDLQMDVPTGSPGVFYLDNTSEAESQGGEFELTIRPVSGLSLFGGLGILSTEFGPGSTTAGLDVSRNDLPFAPRTTWNAGTEYSQTLRGRAIGFVRIEGIGTGRYQYDALNGASQSSFALVNTRVGVANGSWRVDAWVKNLFDKDYVPLAFAYPLAASGYVGESGAPRTIGISLARSF